MNAHVVSVERALDNTFVEIKVSKSVSVINPESGLATILESAKRIILAALRQRNCIKFYLTCDGIFQKNIEGGDTRFGFKTKATVCLQTSNLDQIMIDSYQKILDSFNTFKGRGSGYIFKRWDVLTVVITKYSPVSGSKYIPTPLLLKGRRCLLNIHNTDVNCFLYCIVAAIVRPKKNATRPGYYKPLLSRFKLHDIEMPMKLSDIAQFEKQNRISVNVFGYDEKEINTFIFPLHQTQYRFDKTVNLLLVNDGVNSHYILIKSLPALLRLKTKYIHSMKTCEFCFRTFSSERVFIRHLTFCKTGKPDISMPENTVLKFKNHQYRMPNVATMYADFEAYQVDANESVGERTTLIGEQKPTGFGYIVVSPFAELCKSVTVYRGEDAAAKFVDTLISECNKLETVLKNVKPMEFTVDDEVKFYNSEACSICLEPLDWEDEVDPVCRDHCHISGHFRGASHSTCNLRAQQQKRMIVYFHNGKGYDFHLIMQALADDTRVGTLEVIGNTTEKYTQIKTRAFVIRDSMSHLIGSLDSLASSLLQRGELGFELVRNEFPKDDQFRCALKKLVYPYDYIDGFHRFEESIPEIEHFYNRLTDEELAEEEYSRLLRACKIFGIRNLGQLHDLYLKIDTLILACVFEDYRKLAMEMTGLDPAYYISSPSYSFDAMLFTSKVELEMLQDQRMYEFFEAGMRGGCSTIFKRLATANNVKLKSYDPRVEESEIFYTDCNNLYGYCMQMKLPDRDMRWLSKEEIENLDIKNFDANGEYGLVLEVDMEYPNHLHYDHRDFPLAPEKLEITRDMLCKEMTDFLDRFGLDFNKQVRLTQNVLPKERYVSHVKNLQFYEEEGLVITKIHRAIMFHQSAWMADYIKTNTEKRITARSKFEKDFYKLLINSVFGKTCENVRNYKSIHIVTSKKQAKRLIERVQYKSVTIISPTLVIIESEKMEVTLCKPIYAGMVILELAKLHMYKFHFKVMRPLFSNKIELCFSDTDSLCYHIKDGNISSKLAKISKAMDFSNYDPTHPLYSTTNKSIPGRFKDEMAGDTIIQFAGCRAKSYSMVTAEQQKMAAAGVKRCMHRCLRHVDYVDTIASSSLKNITQNTLISKKHKIYMQESERVALSFLDIKRIVLGNGVDTIPYGYNGYQS